MITSQTTVTSLPTDDLTNTTNNNFNGTGATNIFTDTTTITPDVPQPETTPTNEEVTNVTAFFDDSIKRDYPTIWLEIFIPVGCVVVFFIIFFAVYCLRIRKQNSDNLIQNNRLHGVDNVGFQKGKDTHTLEGYEEVIVIGGGSTNDNGQASTAAQRKVEVDKVKAGKLLEIYETVNLPAKNDSGDAGVNKDSTENDMELYEDVKLPKASSHNDTTTKSTGADFDAVTGTDDADIGIAEKCMEIYEDVKLPKAERKVTLSHTSPDSETVQDTVAEVKSKSEKGMDNYDDVTLPAARHTTTIDPGPHSDTVQDTVAEVKSKTEKGMDNYDDVKIPAAKHTIANDTGPDSGAVKGNLDAKSKTEKSMENYDDVTLPAASHTTTSDTVSGSALKANGTPNDNSEHDHADVDEGNNEKGLEHYDGVKLPESEKNTKM